MTVLWIVNFCYKGRKICVGNDTKVTVPYEKASANYVPAAAVIRRKRALSGIIGCKACVGGIISLLYKPGAQLRQAVETVVLEYGRGKWNF